MPPVRSRVPIDDYPYPDSPEYPDYPAFFFKRSLQVKPGAASFGLPDPDSPAYPEYPKNPEYPGYPDYEGRPDRPYEFKKIRRLPLSLDS